MPNWCSNVMRITNEDQAVLDRVEELCKYRLWLASQPTDGTVEPPPALSGENYDEDEEGENNLYLFHFEYVYEIFDCRRDVTGITCVFSSRWEPPEDLYEDLKSFGCVVLATYHSVDLEACGLYENGAWHHWDSATQVDAIPEIVKNDHGLPYPWLGEDAT